MQIHTFISTYHLQESDFPVISFILHEPIQDLLAKRVDISKTQQLQILALIDKARKSVPLAYLTHEAYFFTEKFFVDERVLIPRSETEYLVEISINYCKDKEKPLHICDMCTGSGCIGICIAKYVSSNHHISLSDISADALDVCRINVQSVLKNDHNITLIQSDLFKNYPQEKGWKINVLVSNPPYIPSSRIPLLETSVKEYEPHLALDGGRDGTTLIEQILAKAKPYLAEEFLILIEIDHSHAKKVQEIATKHYPQAIAAIEKDLFGKERYLRIQQD